MTDDYAELKAHIEKLEAFSKDAQSFIDQLLVKVFPERFTGAVFNVKRDPWAGAEWARCDVGWIQRFDLNVIYPAEDIDPIKRKYFTPVKVEKL